MQKTADNEQPNVEAMREWRRHLHQNPELGFDENQTSAYVAERLKSFGYEVHRDIGTTGVVALLRFGDSNSGPRIAFRADMDALPIQEDTGLPWASRNPGVMHACGHDGHTAMLLGAADLIARRKAAGELTGDGVLTLVFQPAEELGGGDSGARRMIADGLFRDFPVDAIYGIHNGPAMTEGFMAFHDGAALCASSYAKLTFKGVASHGATPHLARDATLPLAATLLAMQSIIAQNVETGRLATIATGTVAAGTTFNIIPAEAVTELSLRAVDNAMMATICKRLEEVASAQAAAFGCTVDVDIRETNPATVNTPEHKERAMRVARELLGETAVGTAEKVILASEDFAHFLKHVPGAYFVIGNGDGGWADGKPIGPMGVHNPHYDFNDEILPVGAAFWAALAADHFARDERADG